MHPIHPIRLDGIGGHNEIVSIHNTAKSRAHCLPRTTCPSSPNVLFINAVRTMFSCLHKTVCLVGGHCKLFIQNRHYAVNHLKSLS
jgi:hypothetical protein